MDTFSNSFTEYSPQMEGPELFPSDEWMGSTPTGLFGEDEELELAIKLLELRNEKDLDHFLGDLVRRAGKAIGKVVKSATGNAVGDLLKGVVRKALPVAGAALGGWLAGPLGAQLGKGLVATAGQGLGLELEGLSPEDREFEAARQFVRFAAESARNALETGPAEPHAVARRAVAEAGRTHAPGFVRLRPSPRAAGQWVRHRGNVIVLEV